MGEPITTYKGTDKDMKCRGFQYELDKTAESDGAVRCGVRGLHSCETPLDVLSYYKPDGKNRYFQAEANAATSGYQANAATSGKNCISAALGRGSAAKAALGSWIVLANYDNDRNITAVQAAQIDGETLKADTWYTMKDGKIVETEANE